MLLEHEGRMEVYVDDPILPIAASSQEEAKRLTSLVLWWWVALGLRLSWAKASFGTSVRWIGAMLTVGRTPELTYHMPPEFLAKLREDASEGNGAVEVSTVKRLAARVGWAGTVIHVLRPFASALWAAASDAERHSRSLGMGRGNSSRVTVMVARARLGHTYGWIRALCGYASAGLVARVPLMPSAWAEGLSMIFDASPFGGGGFVTYAGEVLGWFATAWNDADRAKPGIRRGDHRDQALCELYAVLLGIRVWAEHWSRIPTVVNLRSDSMSALGALDKGRSTRSRAMNLVLQELSLTVAVSPTGLRYRLRHIAGVRNQWSDSLSRLSEPGSGARVPTPLLQTPRSDVEDRVGDWWLTATVPELALTEMAGREEATTE